MPKMIIRRASPDRSKIDLTAHAARHWVKLLDASRDEIAAAVEKVGPNPDTVRKELARQKIDEAEAKAVATK
jgi:transcription antitermination factor NusA-like protein